MTGSMPALEPFVGEWELEAEFVHFDAPPGIRAATSFDRVLDGACILQRATVDLDVAPDAHMLIAPDAERPGAYLQHCGTSLR